MTHLGDAPIAAESDVYVRPRSEVARPNDGRTLRQKPSSLLASQVVDSCAYFTRPSVISVSSN
ncbi:MAG: hypothetical protein JWR90_2939 [Marmoricola sp.]|nr:hypothetical protein [Marmoricola sp.]